MKIQVVTTMESVAWQQYGRRMVDSFLAKWPAAATLAVYNQGFDIIESERVRRRELPAWLADFKAIYDSPAAHGIRNGRIRLPLRRGEVRPQGGGD